MECDGDETKDREGVRWKEQRVIIWESRVEVGLIPIRYGAQPTSHLRVPGGPGRLFLPCSFPHDRPTPACRSLPCACPVPVLYIPAPRKVDIQLRVLVETTTVRPMLTVLGLHRLPAGSSTVSPSH